MRKAGAEDIPLLIGLMREFYAEGGYELEPTRAAEAFAAVISDERLGFVWIIQDGQEDVGHAVLTLRYAMEYGGMVGCLDDLYVRPAWRNKGLSTAGLAAVRKFCENLAIRALTVEVGFDNVPAQRVYERAGFVEAAGRQLLVLPLASPTHVVKGTGMDKQIAG